MSGRSYKKVRKDDKNKKKLKTALKNVATKTQLPKGQNLTDVNFKVKKIVIKDQVKSHGPDELLYHKKLNVAELLSRLGHHNSSVKHEALDGLKNLISYHPDEVLECLHIQVLEAIIKLVLDETGSVRKSSCRIVVLILSAVPQHKLVPFFPSLHSYLLCGLTHIDRGVREDSLMFMDACIKHVPELCEKYGFSLLSVCLDLISEKGVGSRTLSLNLESAQAVTKWRTKVLERINDLLKCLIKIRDPHSRVVSSNQDKTFLPGLVNHFPVYSNCILKMDDIAIDEIEWSEPGTSKFTPASYAESIIPLLMGMFMEVHPVDRAALQSNSTTAINEESCKLLTLIVSILQLLWNLMEQSPTNKQSTRMLLGKFSKSLLQTIVLGRFPYSLSNKVAGKLLKEGLVSEASSSVSLNLAVARLVLLYAEPDCWYHVIPFLKNCFCTSEQLSSSDASVFAECVSKICRQESSSENEYFFNKAVEIALQGNSQLGALFFKQLGATALDPQMGRFHRIPVFEKWLESLPERVTRHKIHPFQMDVISQIAVRRFSSFSKSLDATIELILDNIPSILVVDESKQEAVRWQMANLLYWVEDWDEELTESLQPAVDNCFWGEQLTKYISEIISMKSEASKKKEKKEKKLTLLIE